MAERMDSAPQQWQALHAQMDGLLVQQQQRAVDLVSGIDGMSPLMHEEADGVYGALDGMRQDRLEYADMYELSQLHDRLDDLQRAQHHAQGHAQGMGF